MAALSITERQADSVIILDLNGPIIGDGSLALRNAVRRLLDDGNRNILLNLAGVSYLDSSGIDALISSHSAVKKENGQLKLSTLTKRIKDILAITKLLTVFDSYDSEDEALSRYEP